MLRNGEECNDQEFQERKKNYFSTLPSPDAPEKYILSKMQSDDSFIVDIDDSAEFSDFIKNEIDISDDHHALFFKISSYLGKDIESVKRDIIRYLAKNFKTEFHPIIDLINGKL